jgi:hypothetical protein
LVPRWNFGKSRKKYDASARAFNAANDAQNAALADRESAQLALCDLKPQSKAEVKALLNFMAENPEWHVGCDKSAASLFSHMAVVI